MGLMKIALITGGVLLGVGVVGGIAAGVVSSQKQETVTSPETEKPKPGVFGEMMPNDEGKKNPEEKVSAFTILRQINEEDIVVKSDTGQTKPTENYVFNLKDKTLEVNKNSNKVLTGYSVAITIKEEWNLAQLNDGTLKVRVKVTNDKQQEDKAEGELVIRNFKKADAKLLSLLDKGTDNDKPTEEYSLTVLPKEEKLATFISIDELNTEAKTQPTATKNGLSNWLDNSAFTEEQIKDVTIQGKVKVSAISKEEGKPTLFTLTSSEKDGLLKLVRKDGKTVTEALVGSIKTTNLLATSVSVYPTMNEEKTSKELGEKLLAGVKPSEGNGFKNADGKLQVEIKKTDTPQETSEVNLANFVFKSKTEMETIKVPLGIKVTFGSGADAYSLDSKVEDQAMMLEKAGFSFHIYSRLLDGKDEKTSETLVASDITMGYQELEKYFLNANYKTSSNKPTTDLKDALNPAANGNFVVLNPWADKFKEGKELESNKPTEKQSKYYLVFADYSYTSLMKKDDMSYELKEKVLYTPNLTLIQVQNMDKAGANK